MSLAEPLAEPIAPKAAFKKIPATIITGFLGSGKTTLISNLLKQASGERIAVIVNEFGALDIDAELIRSCPLDCDDTTGEAKDSGIYELANGCICCTVEEEFLPVMKTLVERRHQLDQIIIETSGLALPKPLVQAFNWPEIKQYASVDGVIALVDGPALAAGRFAADEKAINQQRLADDALDHEVSLKHLLEDQLSCADLVLVTKVDCLGAGVFAQVTAQLETLAPTNITKIYALDQTQTELPLLFGLESATEGRIEFTHTHHDHQHAVGEDHSHAHDEFQSVCVELAEVDPKRLQVALEQLVALPGLMRVKGFASLPEKPMRQVVQGVGHRLNTYFDRLWQVDELRKTRLVCIGYDLDEALIKQVLKAAELSKEKPTPLTEEA